MRSDTAAPGPTTRSVLAGLVILRWGTWAWAAAMAVAGADRLARPWLAVVLLAASLAVTARATGVALVRRPRGAGPGWIVAELAVGFALLALEGFAFAPGYAFSGRQGVAGGWPVAGVIAAGVALGPWAGAVGGGAVGAGRFAGVLANGAHSFDADRVASLASTVALYALYGAVAGWLGRLLRDAEDEVARARARTELTREMHDGVLQTLALVVRRTARSDAELARLARDTDRDLRAFLSDHDAGAAGGRGSLASALRDSVARAARPHDLDVTVAVVEDVRLDTRVLRALAGAVGEAVANVGKHAGVSRAVVFAEEQDGGRVFVSVRDQGSGFDLDADVASRGGRGVRDSIVGRMDEVGGRAEIVSAPGRGTEVRLWVP